MLTLSYDSPVNTDPALLDLKTNTLTDEVNLYEQLLNSCDTELKSLHLALQKIFPVSNSILEQPLDIHPSECLLFKLKYLNERLSALNTSIYSIKQEIVSKI